MNHIVSDCMKLGHGLQMVLKDAAVKGNLLTLVQLSRPNWPHRAQRAAQRFLSQRQLRRPDQFSRLCDYLEYLDKELLTYSSRYPVRREVAVADEVTLKRWEARWARVRQRAATPPATDNPPAPRRQRALAQAA